MGKYYRNDLTYEEVAALLAYDPISGLLTHKVAAHNRPAGTVAGRLDVKGYLRVRILNREVKAHRLAWLLTHKKWPEAEIDHINGCPADNRLVNLRDVPTAVNGQNRTRAMRNNKLGVLGVSYLDRKYVAQIGVNARRIRLGAYATVEEAAEAYRRAKEKLHQSA